MNHLQIKSITEYTYIVILSQNSNIMLCQSRHETARNWQKFW